MTEKMIKNTEKLYEIDSETFIFEALVLKCEEKNGKFEVILDRTAFFPTGGGQTCDTGMLESSRVIDVFIHNGDVIHITDTALTVGQTVCGVIDKEERLSKMRSHTAEHILSSYIFKSFGFKNVGFHLGSLDTTCDFDGWLSRDMLAEAEVYVNSVIMENHAVSAIFPSKNELSAIPYRSKLELEDNVRIVSIGKDGEIDLCACCAPHVKATGQIGYFKIVDAYSYKGGMRIHLLTGFDAISRAGAEHYAIRTLSELLSAKPYSTEVISGVERVLSELSDTKTELNNTRTALSEAYTVGVKAGEPFVLHIDQPDGDLIKRIALSAKSRGASSAFIFGGNSDCRFALIGDGASEKFASLKAEFSARGGGKDIICGSMKVDNTLPSATKTFL